MISPLHVDVFNQSNYMLSGVTMNVRMTRSKCSFVIMAKSDVTESFKLDILSAKVCMWISRDCILFVENK